MTRPLPFVLGAALALTAVFVSAQARTHDLKLLPQNVHWGYYDASLKPVLRIAFSTCGRSPLR